MPNSQDLAVCCAVIRCGANYLLLQRPPHKDEGLKWEFPGGKLEAGESEAACIHREIMEELGIGIVLQGRLAAIYKRGPERSIKLMGFLATPGTGAIVLHEHQDYRWVPAEKLASFDLCAGDRVIAELIQERELEALRWWA